MYLVSACLLGQDTKYNGGNNRNEAVIEFAEKHSVFPVCPESRGGLPLPRPPAERVGDRVINREGEDVTGMFLRLSDEERKLKVPYLRQTVPAVEAVLFMTEALQEPQ